MKLAAIYSHPVQYTAPLFRELASRPDVDLMVYFLSRHGLSYDPMFGQSFKWDVPLLDGYPHEFVPKEKLLRLYKDRELLAQMAANVAAGGEIDLSWDRYGASMAAEYRRVMQA